MEKEIKKQAKKIAKKNKLTVLLFIICFIAGAVIGFGISYFIKMQVRKMDQYKVVKKNEKTYQVIKVGNKRASKVFDNLDDAVKYAEANGELISKPKSYGFVKFLICLLMLI